MPALGGRQPLGIQLMAYSGKRQSIPNLFANEITAVSIAGFLTAFGNLQTAIEAVTLGTLTETSWGEKTVESNTRPASKNAQLESQMLVLCQGATTEAPFSFRIPTIDFTAFNYADPPAGDNVIIAGAGATEATTDLIDAIEALCKTPWDEAEAAVVVGMIAER